MIYSQKAANVLLAGAILVGLYFLRHYLGIFALAALTTVLFMPLHRRFQRQRRFKRFATWLTLAAVLLTLLIPLTTLLGIAAYQTQQIIHNLQNAKIGNGQQLTELSSNIDNAGDTVGLNLNRDEIQSKLSDLLKNVIPGILSFISHTVGSVISVVSDSIIYFTLLVTMLAHGPELIQVIKRLSPLDTKIDDEYIARAKAMAVSMTKGTLIIAVVIGLVAAFTLWIIGFPYIASWFLLFTFLSLIPLGAGIVFMPIGGILILTGNLWQGLLVLAVQFIILNNVDNVLRPRLAPKGSRLPGVLLLISAFSGVAAFGVFGVVYGPIVMVILYTTIEICYRYRTTGLPLKQPV